MSMRYKGSVISATPPTLVTNAGASGAWTLEQQMQANAAGLWPKNGPFNYIEDVFSTWLYSGTGLALSINNGVDLSGKGGLVWLKNRSFGYDNALFDTARGANQFLSSNLTQAQANSINMLNSFNNNGFTLGTDGYTGGAVNVSGSNYASWTFREQPKFFDIVTYTGNSTTGRQIAHNLGSAPGCIIVKNITTNGTEWPVYHRGIADSYLSLNTTNANSAASAKFVWGNDVAVIPPTDTVFTVGGANAGFSVNRTGEQYVAYLFAHNAGGFGVSGTDNVISCGSYVGNSTTPPTINLGWEPQWILLKDASASGADARFNWTIVDNMRGLVAGRTSDQAQLFANTADAEDSGTFAQVAGITATGFVAGGQRNTTGNTYIYIAIRRGPMRTPTTGTSVFDPETATASTGTSRTIGFPADMSFGKARTITASNLINDRLRGYANSNTTAPALFTNLTSAEDVSGTSANVYNVWNTTALDGAYFNNLSTVWYHFRRAPGFFDEVCYTGDGGNPQTVSHNLGVAPEMVIVKRRNAGASPNWTVGLSFTSTPYRDGLYLNATNALIANDNEINGATSSTIAVRNTLSASGGTFVAYLFASCPGVSKVGSYTGTGSTQTINCGFTAGARFVLIKRTDSTGAWFVWDTARGMVSGTDPRLALNNTDAEINQNWVYTSASGFQIVTSNENVNTDGGTYIFLAIA